MCHRVCEKPNLFNTRQRHRVECPGNTVEKLATLVEQITSRLAFTGPSRLMATLSLWKWVVPFDKAALPEATLPFSRDDAPTSSRLV